jgi:hypothetical protein
MGIFGKTGSLRLLGREETLLPLGDFEKPRFRFTMTSWNKVVEMILKPKAAMDAGPAEPVLAIGS